MSRGKNFLGLMVFLPPATKLRQGNVFTPVILFQGGVCHNPPKTNPPAPGRPPWADTPLDRHPQADNPPPAHCIHGYGQQAGGTHPTGMHSCFLGKFAKYEVTRRHPRPQTKRES